MATMAGTEKMHRETAASAVKVSSDLREIAAARPDRRVEVLVEVQSPRPKVSVTALTAHTLPRLKRTSTDDRVTLEAAADRLRALLQRMAVETPVWLPAARAFVIEIEAGRLAEIARSTAVRRIWPNRQLKKKQSLG